MKLRTKVLLTIVIVWGLMVSAIYFGSTRILESSYISLEKKQGQASVNQAHAALNSLISWNDTNLKIWSNWDEMYKFMIDHNQEFINKNVSPESILPYQLDLFLFYGEDGQPAFAKELNEDKSQFIPLSDVTKKLFEPDGQLRNLITPPDTNHDAIGLVLTTKGVLIFSARRILTTLGTGTPHGTGIYAQYITGKTLDKLKKSTKLNMEFYSLNDIKGNQNLQNEYDSLIKSNGSLTQTKSNTIYLYSLIKDIHNKPIAMIKINMPRDIRNTGSKTILYFNAAFIITGLLLGLLLFYIIRTLVTDRLEVIDNKINEISKTKDFSLRFPEKGKDEISSVMTEMNKLLTIIYSIETLLTDIINSMPSIIVIINKNKLIRNLNTIAEKELKISTQNVKGESIFVYFPFLKKYEEKINEAIKTQEVVKIDKIQQNKDRYYSIIVYPLRQSGIQGLAALRLDDITERIKINQQLVQTEKLASIGVLTAGVAHEINNPINFVFSAITPLQKNIDDLFEILDKYSEASKNVDAAKKIDEINYFLKYLDFDYTIKEIDELIAGIEEGSNRTASIVKNLNRFTVSDEEEMTFADINKGIDLTLNLLHHKYKNRININKEYGNIPEIRCYPGKLNQVFMNVLSNAMDAINDKGNIDIKTKYIDNTIQIKIKDSGLGIKPENLEKIFDPFFTTKPVGKGTGLGLSISSKIIRELNGTIEVKSALGEGSEFVITLKVNGAMRPT